MQFTKVAGRYDPVVRSSAGALSIPLAWIDVAVGVLCILPLLLTAHLPLTDVPNHLARQYILRDLAHSPVLQQYYAVHWALVPNLALELFTVAVRWALPLALAMRLFCILTVLLLFLGTRWVNREFSGGTSRIYWATPLLCWGGPMQYGFLNYCFGIGLALVLFGAWLRLRSRGMAVRIPFLLVAGTGLMLCHLGAFGLFAIAVGVRELADPRRITCLLPPVLCLVAVFLAFSVFSPTADTAMATAVAFSTLRDKIRSIASITFFTAPRLEGALLVAALGGLVVALLSRTVRWNKVGLGIIAVMGLLWLVMPNSAMGVTYIDYRLPWAISFFVLASLVPDKRRLAKPLGVWFGILTVARVALIAVLWLRWEPTLAAIDHAVSRLPEGARLKVVVGEPGPNMGFRDPDLTNVAGYAVVRRHTFDPGMFASIPGQILFFQPHYRTLWDNYPPASLTTLAPDYDYVLVLVPKLAKIAPDLPLVPEMSGRDFEILKVIRPG